MAYEKRLYEEVMAEYEQLRSQEKQELLKKTAELYQKVPEIAEVDRKLKDTSLSMSLQILNNPDGAEKTLESLKNQIFDLTDRKYYLLAQHGYPKDYLEPSYRCKLCHDTGYINNERCSCLKQRLINKSYQLSNLDDLTRTQNFQTFNAKYYSKSIDTFSGISPAERMHSIYNVCVDFIKEFDHSYSNLLFYGPPGIGKTFLSSCIAKEILDKGHTVIYESSYDLFTLYEDYKFQRMDSGDARSQIDRLYTADLLIIDDLGTEIITRSSIAFLFNLLDTRLRHNRHMVISTNQSVSELSKLYSQRFSSRIFEYFTQLEFIGTDIRLQKMRES